MPIPPPPQAPPPPHATYRPRADLAAAKQSTARRLGLARTWRTYQPHGEHRSDEAATPMRRPAAAGPLPAIPTGERHQYEANTTEVMIKTACSEDLGPMLPESSSHAGAISQEMTIRIDHGR